MDFSQISYISKEYFFIKKYFKFFSTTVFRDIFKYLGVSSMFPIVFKLNAYFVLLIIIFFRKIFIISFVFKGRFCPI